MRQPSLVDSIPAGTPLSEDRDMRDVVRTALPVVLLSVAVQQAIGGNYMRVRRFDPMDLRIDTGANP
jgi:hypothetical protein